MTQVLSVLLPEPASPWEEAGVGSPVLTSALPLPPTLSPAGIRVDHRHSGTETFASGVSSKKNSMFSPSLCSKSGKLSA